MYTSYTELDGNWICLTCREKASDAYNSGQTLLDFLGWRGLRIQIEKGCGLNMSCYTELFCEEYPERVLMSLARFARDMDNKLKKI